MTGPYRAVLAVPGARRPALLGMVAKLPIGMAPLSLLLLGQHRLGSFTEAGALVAGHAVALAVSGPLLGRVADRRGERTVLTVTGLVYPVAAVLLVLALRSGAGLWLSLVAAVGLGSTLPPVSACLRTMWSRLVTDPDLRRTAFSLEAVSIELSFLVGPLVTGLAVTVADPSVSLLVAAAAGCVGALGYARTAPARTAPAKTAPARTTPARRSTTQTSPATRARPTAEPTSPGRPGLGALRAPGLQVLVAVSALQVAAFAFIEVAIPATAQRAGQASLAGVLLAVWAGGSLVGGLVWGGVAGRRLGHLDPVVVYRGWCLVLGLGLLPVAATSVPLALLPLMVLAGVSIAPCSTVGAELVSQVTPHDVRTEAYAWLTTAASLGASAGALAGGAITDHVGPRPALLVGAASALAGAALVAVVGGALRPAQGAAESVGRPDPDEPVLIDSPVGPAPLAQP